MDSTVPVWDSEFWVKLPETSSLDVCPIMARKYENQHLRWGNSTRDSRSLWPPWHSRCSRALPEAISFLTNSGVTISSFLINFPIHFSLPSFSLIAQYSISSVIILFLAKYSWVISLFESLLSIFFGIEGKVLTLHLEWSRNLSSIFDVSSILFYYEAIWILLI